MSKVHIVSHTHWDREWYFSTMDSLVLSEQLFGDVIHELTTNPNVNFCLDGQSSILDDYLELHPEYCDVVSNLIKDKRLFVGPWYTQSDCIIPHEESILRNLQIGVKDIKKYGETMPIGYLPDTFGFNAQMPTILNQAGFDNIVFWRGLDFTKQIKNPYFMWKGLGNSEVYAATIPNSYSAASLIESSDEFVNNRLKPALEFLNQNEVQEDVLIAAGGDQLNIVSNINKIVQEINDKIDDEVIVSTYPQFVETLRNKENLESYQGDFREPKYGRIHRTIGSVRYSIKNENAKIEQKLFKTIEPLLVIAKANNINVGTELLIKLWKNVLQCQAHDSMGGCVSDEVFDDIMHRYKEANEICDGIENTIVYKIHEHANLSEDEILLINTESSQFYGCKEITFVAPDRFVDFEGVDDLVLLDETKYEARENILTLTAEEGYTYIDEPQYSIFKARVKVALPAFGYKAIKMIKSDKEMKTFRRTNSNSISLNGKTVSFENGFINYCDGNHCIENVISIVDCGNDGDTYDFSPLENEQETLLKLTEAYALECDSYKTLVVTGTTMLPKTLEDRVIDNPTLVPFEIKLFLTLNELTNLLEGKLEFDNNIDSHRIRLKINTNNNSNEYITQIQAGFQTRYNEIIPENWQDIYPEKPVNIYGFNRSVSTVKEHEAVTVYSNALREVEKDDTFLYLTVLATTGELGKPYLNWRPGRASGDTTMQGHTMMPTPKAQEHHLIETEFAISLCETFNEKEVFINGEKICVPSISYQSQKLNYFIHRLDNKLQRSKQNLNISKTFSLFDIDDKLIISSICPSLYNNDYFTVRFINPTNKVIALPESIVDMEYTFINALEESIESKVTIEPYDFVTIKVKYNK